ncbi:MAG: acyl-[acyl-carrier-protein] thioesterase [Proteiniphilum sp.]|jgi:acyl-ACP thioesterase|nr:acyl-[acyl-carrier-protein] thioesterase [Proteiniphilum sp.]
MGVKKKYIYDIRAHDVDFRRRVSLRSLTGLLLLTAGRNADENGFGLLELQTEHYTWVLSRLAVEMERFPTEEDTLSVETWIEHVGMAFTSRNFRMTDGSGTVIGHAASSWAMIDMRTRRSVRLDTIPSMQHFVVPEGTPAGEPVRIGDTEGETANSFTVKYSDIDINGHVNSMNYVQWLSDCFPLDFYRTHHIRRFEINFLKEITCGDSGTVRRRMTAPDDYLFRIETQEKGIACRARILFKEAPQINVAM